MNKGQLRAHLIALMNRSDLSNALADTFIDQALQRINRNLRIPPMEKQVQYNISSATTFITLPNDFLEVIDVYMNGLVLDRVTMREMVPLRDQGRSGPAEKFVREQGKLLLYPEPSSGTLTLNYYAEIPQLTSDSDENFITVIASDLVTYGAMCYAADYFIDERGSFFEQKFAMYLSELQSQGDDGETAGTVIAMTPATTYE